MRRISSKTTFFYKRIFPVLWFGAIGCLGLNLTFPPSRPGTASIALLILIPVLSYIVIKIFIFDLIDEVYDEGSSILFKNSGKEVRVSIKDIENVSYFSVINLFMGPLVVTASIGHKTELGNKLRFIVQKSSASLTKNRDIEELINRIDTARG